LKDALCLLNILKIYIAIGVKSIMLFCEDDDGKLQFKHEEIGKVTSKGCNFYLENNLISCTFENMLVFSILQNNKHTIHD